MAKLADIDNLCGAKVSTPDAEIIFNLSHATRDKSFNYIVGCETAFYAGLYAGAKAVIGQGTSVNPKVINAVQAAYDRGDQEAALAAQEDTNALVYGCGNPVDFYKRYATEQGFAVKPYFRSMNPNPYGFSRSINGLPDTNNERWQCGFTASAFWRWYAVVEASVRSLRDITKTLPQPGMAKLR